MGEEQNRDRPPKPVRPLPEPTLLERFDEATRAAATAVAGAKVPIGGDYFAAFISHLCPSIRARRTDAWLEELRVAINYLSKHTLRAEDLIKDEAFHDLVCEATEAARRTHLGEKREALRNAVINGALPKAPSEVKQHLFIRLVDDLSELHLGMLRFLHDPNGWFQAQGRELPKHDGPTGMALDPATSRANLGNVLRVAFPTYANEPQLRILVVSELHQRGLVLQLDDNGQYRAPDWNTLVLPHRRFGTQLGGEFLRFIRDPKPDPN